MLTKLIAGFRSSFRTYAARNALMDLNNAALDDIGLTRADVMSLSVRGEPVRTKSVPGRAPRHTRFAFQATAQAA